MKFPLRREQWVRATGGSRAASTLAMSRVLLRPSHPTTSAKPSQDAARCPRLPCSGKKFTIHN